jgi:hypothetical protein
MTLQKLFQITSDAMMGNLGRLKRFLPARGVSGKTILGKG